MFVRENPIIRVTAEGDLRVRLRDLAFLLIYFVFPIALAAYTKVFCSKMVRGRRSDAQKSQVKALETIRKTQS